MNIAFIINPISGTSNKHDLPEKIERKFRGKNNIKCVFTQYAGHAEKLVEQLVEEGYKYIVACGGDGTVNEVASRLVNTDAVLGIIPFGSGNGLARHIRMPMNADKAIDVIASIEDDRDEDASEETYSNIPLIIRKAREKVQSLSETCKAKVVAIDYGKANDHFFFCTCGTGFDAHISDVFGRDGKRGFFTYLRLMCVEWWKYRPYVYELEMGGVTLVQKAFLITCANASQYGNNAFIAPHASTRDGEMDICIMKPFWLFSIPNVVVRLMTKKIEESRHFSVIRTKKLILRRPEEGIFHIDGEPVTEGKEINIEIFPKGLKVITRKQIEEE